MFSGAETEWFPTLGESWHVPHVPGIEAKFKSSFSPATPVMLIGFELNSIWPRTILARRSFRDALAHASKRLKRMGVNGVSRGFPPSGSLMPTKKAGVIWVARLTGPPDAPFSLRAPAR